MCVVSLFFGDKKQFPEKASERGKENKKGRRLISYAAGTIENRLYSTCLVTSRGYTERLTDVALVGKRRQLHALLVCFALNFVACGQANEWKSLSLRRDRVGRQQKAQLLLWSKCVYQLLILLSSCALSGLIQQFLLGNESKVDSVLIVLTEYTITQANKHRDVYHFFT